MIEKMKGRGRNERSDRKKEETKMSESKERKDKKSEEAAGNEKSWKKTNADNRNREQIKNKQKHKT